MQMCPFLPLLFSITLKVLDHTLGQEKQTEVFKLDKRKQRFYLQIIYSSTEKILWNLQKATNLARMQNKMPI